MKSGNRESWLCRALSLLAATLLVAAPLENALAEPTSSRWVEEDSETMVQLEITNGTLKVVALTSDESCGLEVCGDVFRGRMDGDRTITGESRTCSGKDCGLPRWTPAMGMMNQSGDRIRIIGGIPSLRACGGSGAGWSNRKGHAATAASPSPSSRGSFRLVRVEGASVNCSRTRRFREVSIQIHPGLSREEALVLEESLKELEAAYPEERGEVHLLRGRIRASEGSRTGYQRARVEFESAIGRFGKAWGHCEMAILAATYPEYADQGEGDRHLRECASRKLLTCRDLKSSRAEVLKGGGMFWDLWRTMDCGQR